LELRHLRYFVAAAEAKSLKFAAEKLHTTQPSLSRQIRDLEHEIGTPLFLRGARGVELTPAGRVFLDHARVMLAQAEAALQSARRIADPARPSFSLGFMIGHDSTWLPETLQLLRDELPNIHVTISTQNSPQLAAALSQGILDIAFLRAEDGLPELEFRRLVEEPLEVFLPKDHPLAERKAIRIQEIVGETFISVSGTALSVSGKPPALRLVIDRYLNESNVDIRPSHEVDNLGSVMSLIASTRGIALLPAYAKTFLPKSVTTRPLQGVKPKIDLSLGYRKTNTSPTLKLMLSKADELVARTRGRVRGLVPAGGAAYRGIARVPVS
jgi:LysR family transcriptional regulator, hca operon transcriptional activator